MHDGRGLPPRGAVTRRATLRAAVGGGTLSALGLTGCTGEPAAPSPSEAPMAARFPGDPGPGRLYFGASLAIDEPAASRTDLGGTAMSMVRRFYRPHQTELMLALTRTDVASGIVPFVSFKVPGTWAEAAAGHSDAWLDTVIEAVDSLGAPVFLALHHEPENDVTANDFARDDWLRMQQRALARSQEVARVTLVPVLMSWSFQHRSRRKPQEWIVPDAPLIGVDVYNPWRPDGPEQWVEFADLIGAIRRVVPDRPLIVPETAATADPFDPLRAALWLRGAFDTAVREDVVGLAWFDAETEEGRDRRLDDAGREEFRALLERDEVVRFDEVG